MKAAISIFAFYLLALSLVPCSDGGMDIVEIVSSVFGIDHLSSSDHEQHSNDCGDDTCSTFCICNCCSIALDILEALPFRLKTPPPTPNTTPSFVAHFIPNPSPDAIWHPPRLS